MLLYAIITLILLGYAFFKHKYSYWKKRGVPNPEPSLIFGNVGRAVFMSTMMSRICNDIYDEYTKYAYVGLYNFWTPAIVVRDVELVKDVMIKKFNNFHDNWINVEREVDPIMALNPFILQGQQWKTIRSQLNPQYIASKLKGMIPLMENVGENMVRYVKQKSDSSGTTVCEAKEFAARYTGEAVLSCAYGLEGKSYQDDVPVAFKIGEEIASPNFIVQVKQTVGMFFPLLRRLFKISFLGCPIPKVFWDMILDTIKYRDQNNIVRKDYLDFIRDLKKPGASPYEITEDFVVAHAFTFFLDSFETSSISLTYTLYELGLNPDVQEKARQEVDGLLDKYKGKLSHEALMELEYLDNIISESLRKHPILNFFSRICTEECTFPSPTGSGNEVKIEKGVHVYLPVHSIHHDPEFYPDPDRFDPDRFTDAIKSTRPKSTFMGFGDGPRICLGKNYAIQQIKIALSYLLRNFEIRINSKTKPLGKELLHVLNVPRTDILVDFVQRS